MVIPGNIIRFNDYQFEDGGKPKPKYAIVLYCLNHEEYIYTLTTSDRKLRFDAEKKGCHTYNADRKNYNRFKYYHFPENDIIGIGQFYFDVGTYINFYENVRVGSIPKLIHLCQNNGGVPPACILDIISEQELDRLRKCLINSTLVSKDIMDLINKSS